MVEERVQVFGDVLRTRHFLVYVVEVLLTRRGEINDIAFVAKLFDGFLRGECLQERAVVVGRMVGNQCGFHWVTSCNS